MDTGIIARERARATGGIGNSKAGFAPCSLKSRPSSHVERGCTSWEANAVSDELESWTVSYQQPGDAISDSLGWESHPNWRNHLHFSRKIRYERIVDLPTVFRMSIL